MAWEVMPKKALTQSQIYDLYQAARGGDTSALRQLNEVSSYYGKKGNERIRAFEKADMGSVALSRAQHFLKYMEGRETFTRSKKLDAYEAYMNASEARRFLRAKTGTPTKERKRMTGVLEKLSEPTDDRPWSIPEGLQTGAERKSFEKFLSSDAWEEIKNAMGSQTMKDVSERIDQGADVQELIDAYKESLTDKDFNFQDYVSGWAYDFNKS